MAHLCSAAGFKGFFSNHSLRATAATRLFDSDVDEQLIMAKTGHVSTAVRSYKRVSDEKLNDISNIVAGKCAKTETAAATDVFSAEPADCQTESNARPVAFSCDGVNITFNITINKK